MFLALFSVDTRFKRLKADYDTYQQNKRQLAEKEKEVGAKTKNSAIAEKQLNSLKAGLENLVNIISTIEQIRQCIGKIKESERKLQTYRRGIAEFKRENPGIENETLTANDVPDISHLVQKSRDIQLSIDRSGKLVDGLTQKLENATNKKAALDEKSLTIRGGAEKLKQKQEELETIQQEVQEAEANITVATRDLDKYTEKEDEFKEKKQQLQRKKAKFDEDNLELKHKAASMLQDLQKYSDLWESNQNKSKKKREIDMQKDR